MSLDTPPLITIGMPVYNGEKFICEAIDSLVTQTEKRFKLIISDNGSTDQTYKICTEYASKDPRISVYRHKKNVGAALNFSFVVQQATSPYFIWAACDDVWDSNWLEVLLALQRKNVALTFGKVTNITENGKPFKSYENKDFYHTSVFSKLRFFLEEDTFGKANIIYGMYRTDLLKKAGLNRFESVSYASDMLFVYNILQYGDILFSQDNLN